jgi:hypothetical protein
VTILASKIWSGVSFPVNWNESAQFLRRTEAALLRLNPMFDPLRNDPRFQKLAASPTPKKP